MDGFLFFAFLVAFFYFLHSVNKLEKNATKLQSQMQLLQDQVNTLLKKVSALETQSIASVSTQTVTEPIAKPTETKPAVVSDVVEQPKSPSIPVVVAPMKQPIVPPPPSPAPIAESPTSTKEEVVRKLSAAAARVVTPPTTAPLQKEFTPPPIKDQAISITTEQKHSINAVKLPPPTVSAKAPEPKVSLSMEEKVGANWFVKIGAVMMFAGIVWAGNFVWGTLHEPGRVFLLYVFGVAMLWLGIGLEKRDNYLILGRSLLGMGWAVLFFTTYAMYHAPATKVLDSLAIDMFLMLGVMVAMVIHTLKYDSQLVTGFAFLLGFFAISVNHGSGTDGTAGLLAGPVLVVGLSILVASRRWWELEVFGILAAYTTHFLWLLPMVKRDEMGHVDHFPGYEFSVAALCTYWLVFRWSYVRRDVDEKSEEDVSTVAALLNSFAFLSLMKFQSVHPELAFWALLVLGTVELMFAQYAKARGRRMAFLVLATVGVCLLTAAIPFKFADSPGRLSMIWLAGAQAFLVLGIFSEEILFRRMGKLVSMLAAVTLLFTSGIRHFQALMDNPNPVGDAASSIHSAGLGFFVAALVLWSNAHIAKRRWSGLFSRQFDEAMLVLLSWSAMVLGTIAVVFITPDTWVPVGLSVLMVALAAFGKLRNDKHWLQQSLVMALVAASNLLYDHHGFDEQVGWFKMEIYVAASVAILMYAASYFARHAEDMIPSISSSLLTWLAAFIMSASIYRAIPEAWVAPAWAIYALIIIIGARIVSTNDVARQQLVLQSHMLGAFVFARAITVNLAEPFRQTSVQLETMLLCAASFYALTWLTNIPEIETPDWMSQAQSWLGSTVLTWLMWYWLGPTAVAVGWALFGLVIFEIGIWRKASYLRWQAYLAFELSFIRIYFANINAEKVAGEISPIVITILPLVAIYYYAYWRLLDTDGSDLNQEGKLHVAGGLACLGTITLATIMRFEIDPHWVVVGWASLLLALMMTSWLTDRTIFRYQALAGIIPVGFRLITYNLFEHADLANSLSSRFVSEGISIALMLACLPAAFVFRNMEAVEDAYGWMGKFRYRPDQFFFLAAVALTTIVLFFRLEGGFITLAWGVEAIVVFVFALMVSERSYRLCGLALLMGCIAKIGFVDYWKMETSERVIVLMGVGGILTVVGFLYGKNRDRLRELL